MDEYYKWYKDHGICVQCHQYNAAPNRVRCDVCLAQNAEAHKGQRANKEKMREYNKRMRAERKSKGLCIDCGKPICSKSKCYCIDCRLKALKRNKKTDNPVEYRVENGLCKICGKEPLIPGKKLCVKCYETVCNNLKQGENGREQYRDYMRKQNKLIFNN